MQKLTQREKQVLKLLLIGKSYREIAKELCIARATVEKHIGKIYQKINVQNRVELILKLKESR